MVVGWLERGAFSLLFKRAARAVGGTDDMGRCESVVSCECVREWRGGVWRGESGERGCSVDGAEGWCGLGGGGRGRVVEGEGEEGQSVL